ncbi:MAG: YqhA family protein, partial [Anaerolineae bacterium]|nr:YqhA family protein [Anaerolineae bacterium]
FFVLGGIGLIGQLLEVLASYLGGVFHTNGAVDKGVVIFEVVEFVHLFLVGTVLYITAVGLYQLFIKEIKFPQWLKIDS